MKFLRDLFEITDISSRSPSPDALPKGGMDIIQKSIRDGTKPDKETGQYQNWSNALHLVHKAYQINNVQRPTPDMQEAWKQYEENIQFAVKELAKTHGIKGDWRMSSSIFHEALEMAKGNGVEVEVTDGDETTAHIVSAQKAEDIIDSLKETATVDGYKVKILQEDEKRTITFWRNNVKKKGFSVTIHS